MRLRIIRSVTATVMSFGRAGERTYNSINRSTIARSRFIVLGTTTEGSPIRQARARSTGRHGKFIRFIVAHIDRPQHRHGELGRRDNICEPGILSRFEKYPADHVQQPHVSTDGPQAGDILGDSDMQGVGPNRIKLHGNYWLARRNEQTRWP